MGEGRNSSGVWEILLAVFLVLVSAVAFAQQAEKGVEKSGPKRIIHGKPADRRAVEMLLDESDGDAAVDAADKTIIKLKGKFKIDRNKPIEEAVVDFIDRHRNAFGLNNAKEELILNRKDSYNEGDVDLRFNQSYRGVPIWGCEVLVHLDKTRELDNIISDNIPTPSIDTNPRITKVEAIEIAKNDKIAKEGGAIHRPLVGLYIYIIINWYTKFIFCAVHTVGAIL